MQQSCKSFLAGPLAGERNFGNYFMKKKLWWYIGFFAILFLGFYIFLYSAIDFSRSRLPVISIVKPFHFLRQDGKTITEKDVEGKVYVVEYFFTTCKGICPKMNTNMEKVFDQFKDQPGFLILSHTVDPATDSVAKLNHYADSLGVNGKNWWFLYGPKTDLYKAARESYLLDDPKNNTENIAEQFIHTQFFALVDKNGQVRGIYDGLKKDELKKLDEDIRDLLKEKGNKPGFVNNLFSNNPQ